MSDFLFRLVVRTGGAAGIGWIATWTLHVGFFDAFCVSLFAIMAVEIGSLLASDS